MKTTLEVVRRYLQHWDPIGVIPDLIKDGHAPTEYDGYADHIYSLLAQGCSAEELRTHLTSLATKSMGLNSNPAHDEMIAVGLHRYFNNESGFRK